MCAGKSRTNVDAGLANGTQGTIEKVWLKHGEQTSFTAVNGHNVKCVHASQIHHVDFRTEHRLLHRFNLAHLNTANAVSNLIP